MSVVMLTYHVPVVVEVDLDDERVVRVTEHAGDTKPDVETSVAENEDRAADVARALDIAEDADAQWPEWDRSY